MKIKNLLWSIPRDSFNSLSNTPYRTKDCLSHILSPIGIKRLYNANTPVFMNIDAASHYYFDIRHYVSFYHQDFIYFDFLLSESRNNQRSYLFSEYKEAMIISYAMQFEKHLQKFTAQEKLKTNKLSMYIKARCLIPDYISQMNITKDRTKIVDIRFDFFSDNILLYTSNPDNPYVTCYTIEITKLKTAYHSNDLKAQKISIEHEIDTYWTLTLFLHL